MPKKPKTEQPTYISHAPWTADQVASLQAFQTAGSMHPFTGENSKGEKVDLIPTEAGWIAEEGGAVVQDWCHYWMENWSWVGGWLQFRPDKAARYKAAFEHNPVRS